MFDLAIHFTVFDFRRIKRKLSPRQAIHLRRKEQKIGPKDANLAPKNASFAKAESLFFEIVK
jgi:hypothetical protein